MKAHDHTGGKKVIKFARSSPNFVLIILNNTTSEVTTWLLCFATHLLYKLHKFDHLISPNLSFLICKTGKLIPSLSVLFE